jgi:CheY-like chemotaxis protein
LLVKLLKLIHWSEEEAKERAKVLRAGGYEVDCRQPKGLSFLRDLREVPPAAIVIDLSRLPMQGRDIALAIRHQKATRNIPIVFVAGSPEKVDRVMKSLPDAVFTSWSKVAAVLKKAIANPPAEPVVPPSVLAGYSGTPLPKKLGIKPNSVVGLVNAPKGFERALAPLPEGARPKRSSRISGDVALWFVRSKGELAEEVGRRAKGIGGGKLWIVWPKRSSVLATDLGQQEVRAAGLGAGLVDFKICSLDETWSGLLFTRRKLR